MKVLHIVKTAAGAGWVYQLVRVLRSLGVEVVVALPSDTEGFAPRYREAGAMVVRADLDLPARQPWRIPATLAACRRLVESVRPDLIHTHHVGTTFVVRLALGKHSSIPRIFQVPGPLHLEHDFFARVDILLAGPQDTGSRPASGRAGNMKSWEFHPAMFSCRTPVRMCARLPMRVPGDCDTN